MLMLRGVTQASTIAGYQTMPPELKAKLLAALQRQQAQTQVHQPGTMPTEVRKAAELSKQFWHATV